MRGLLLACASAMVLAAPAHASDFVFRGALASDGDLPELEFSITGFVEEPVPWTFGPGSEVITWTGVIRDIEITLTPFSDTPPTSQSVSFIARNYWSGWTTSTWFANATFGQSQWFSFQYQSGGINASLIDGSDIHLWNRATWYEIRGDTPMLAFVPEPATWAMMLGGFGIVGAAMRRRKGSVPLANKPPMNRAT